MCRVLCPAVQQVAFADKILLNKTDLVSAADKANVLKRIRVSSWLGTLLSGLANWPLPQCSTVVAGTLHKAATMAATLYV